MSRTSPDSATLKPCPFCGSTDIMEGVYYAEGEAKKRGAVRCAGCGVRGPTAVWNRRFDFAQRPIEPTVSELIAWFKSRSHGADAWGATVRDIERALSSLSATSAPAKKPLAIIQAAADEVVSRVCEWDDRTSPDDFPEALLITPTEFHRELVRFAEDIGALADTSTDRGGK